MRWQFAVAAGACALICGAAPAAASAGWAVQSSPNPTTAGSTLTSVSCRSAACIAVGYYVKKSSQYGQIPEPLAERWNGTSWAIQSGPQPGAQGSELAGVSCPSASSCTAAGWYTSKSGITRTLAERWNGTSWATQATPNPAVDITAQLDGVSCTSASACTAVGWYISSATGNTGTLVERWNGTQWSIQTSPNPAGAAQSQLNGVSCSSGTACTAVGESAVPGSEALAEQWNGTRWSIAPTPDPQGSTLTEMTGVSCPSASSCTASGWYSTGGGTELTLAERWNGSQWAIQPTPNPSGAATTILGAVSCPDATACTAAGATGDKAVTEAWNGTTWTVQPMPSPAKANASDLTGVSCVAAATCTAVGDWNYGAANPVGQTLAEHEQG